jgi:hypothetical protein
MNTLNGGVKDDEGLRQSPWGRRQSKDPNTTLHLFPSCTRVHYQPWGQRIRGKSFGWTVKSHLDSTSSILSQLGDQRRAPHFISEVFLVGEKKAKIIKSTPTQLKENIAGAMKTLGHDSPVIPPHTFDPDFEFGV